MGSVRYFGHYEKHLDSLATLSIYAYSTKYNSAKTISEQMARPDLNKNLEYT